MIEIKSVSGKVLYIAKDATDIRSALVSAAKEGAYLRGAYLEGAYLERANLEREVWTKVASALKTSLQAMNDGGHHWVKGSLTKNLEDGSMAYCSVGSVQAHSDGTVRVVAIWLLSSVCGGSIENFNDFKGTTWEDVKAVFGVAIKHAERFAAE